MTAYAREAVLRELDALEDAEWDTPERRERLLRRAGMWQEPARLENPQKYEAGPIPTFEPGPDTGERFTIWYVQAGEWIEFALRYRNKEKAEHIRELLFAPRFGRSVVLRHVEGMTGEEVAAALSDLIAAPQAALNL